MGVYKLSANSVKNGRTIYGSMLAGNAGFLPTSFESIATVTVGSGGASTITFSSIPGTYTHLQIRGIMRDTFSGGTGIGQCTIIVNSDSASNYAFHWLQGDGSTASAFGYANRNDGWFAGAMPKDADTASSYGVMVSDILDYANTNKFKTYRDLSGVDLNGSGKVFFQSGLWRSTSAITSLTIYPNISNFKQYTTFALYGIKVTA